MVERYLLNIQEAWSIQYILIMALSLSFAISIIFFERKEPQIVWTWLLLIYLTPIGGFFLYLFIGRNYRKDQMFKVKEIEDELSFAAMRQEATIEQSQLNLRNPEMERFENLILYNLQTTKAVLTDNNNVQIYTDGLEKFQALMHEIEYAKQYIHLQYYIIRDDKLWNQIRDLLMQKAKQGVEVRVLYDGMGSRMIRKRRWDEMKESGIEVAEFYPAKFGLFQLRINYRNHRKIAVIDGRVGFVGGFNIGKEYLGEEKRFGYWRDTHLCIEGAAVTTLAVRFALDWNYATKENLFLKDQLFQIPKYLKKGDEAVQIISSGPDSKYQQIRNNYVRLIHKARKRIYIQTPYFVPDETVVEALKMAINSGVDVRVMIPSKPDHPFVYWATYSYIGELIEEGAKCYVYNNGFLHSKVLTVDGLVTCCGTANMDIRSFKLNFEVNAVVFNEKTTRIMERKFETDMSNSTRVTKKAYRMRNIKVRVREQFSRLLAPIL